MESPIAVVGLNSHRQSTSMFSLFFLLLAITSLASGECSRAALSSVRDRFWAAGTGKQMEIPGVTLAPDLKISTNNVVNPSLGTSAFRTMGGFTDFAIHAIDTTTCEVASFRVASDQLLSTRLKLDSAGALSEVEFLLAVNGDQFFRPSGFPRTTPAGWNQPQTPGPPPQIAAGFDPAIGAPAASINTRTCKTSAGESRRLTREELIYVASTYCDGLQGKPWESCVLAGSSCPRVENGVQTTSNCGVGTGMFGWPVRGRRWVVDTETGVVLGAFYFDYYAKFKRESALWLHEYFKVQEGKMSYIYAPMKNLPAPGGRFNDVWAKNSSAFG